MTNLETLIQELCPDGVEFVKLGDVGNFYGGLSGKSKADFTDGNAKFITYMNVYSNPALNTDIKDFVKIEEGEKQNKVLYGDILFTGSSETPNECGMTSVLTEKTEEDLYLNSFCFGYRFNDIDEVNPGFMKHLFRSHMLRKALAKTANGVTRFNVSKKKVAKIEIPLPPIGVQTEIVRILDKFTSLEAELEAELDCRKRQYEYYRDKLLSFDNVGGQEVTISKIGDIGRICMCKRIMKNQTNSESGIPFYKIGTFGKVADAYISNDVYEEYKKMYSYPKKGDILMSASGTIGRTVVFNGEPSYFQDSNIVWVDNDETKVFNSYLNYYYQIIEWKTQGGTIKRLYNNLLAGATIKYPSLDEQHRIVSILDRFESLTTSLQSGLPAEIAARRQQYEHYRDKLLTFKRKGAA